MSSVNIRGWLCNLSKPVDHIADWREMHWRDGDIHLHLRSGFVEVSWIQTIDAENDKDVTMTVMDDNFDSVEFILKQNGARQDVMTRFRAIRLLWDSWSHMKYHVPEDQTLF